VLKEGPKGPPGTPPGGPLGAPVARGLGKWCSGAGETLTFHKNERLACTRAPFGPPGSAKGAPWVSLETPVEHQIGPWVPLAPPRGPK
jgi:hypothetical protein